MFFFDTKLSDTGIWDYQIRFFFEEPMNDFNI